jgi:hypothetical protein
MNKKEKEQLRKIDEKLYSLNSRISAMFVTRIQKPTNEHMDIINEHIANIIKELRLIYE